MAGHNIVWSLIAQADFLSKLTLFVLLCMSMVCWIIAVVKLVTLRVILKQLHEGLQRLQTVYNFDELVRKTLHQSYVTIFLEKAAFKLTLLAQKKDNERARLQEKDKELFELSLEELVQYEVAEQERYLSVLSTSAEVAPLIGLFGTVWGIIHAFIRISEAQASDITVVAPGIAEALITTMAGLVVAIPALIMYHYLGRKIEALSKNLHMLTHHIEVVIHKTFFQGS
jgi:biopolymer transport protein TolQ